MPCLSNILRKFFCSPKWFGHSKICTHDLECELDSPSHHPHGHVFSIPFIINSNPNFSTLVDRHGVPETLYVQPRSVLYFEVTIERVSCSDPQEMRQNSLYDECIAVGLASKSFEKSKQLPGWDKESYGYHGDDGGIFHGKGRQLLQYGPSFGCGDVVGCGVDYSKKQIFFTLNGRFLGVAFRDIKLWKELFPTVGIDAQAKVCMNFGLAPFVFNLYEYITMNQ